MTDKITSTEQTDKSASDTERGCPFCGSGTYTEKKHKSGGFDLILRCSDEGCMLNER